MTARRAPDPRFRSPVQPDHSGDMPGDAFHGNVTRIRDHQEYEDFGAMGFEPDPHMPPEEEGEDAEVIPVERTSLRHRLETFMTERDQADQIRIWDFHRRDLALICVLVGLVVVIA